MALKIQRIVLKRLDDVDSIIILHQPLKYIPLEIKSPSGRKARYVGTTKKGNIIYEELESNEDSNSTKDVL